MSQQLLPLVLEWNNTGTGSLYLAVPGGPYGFLSNHFTSPQDTMWAQVSLVRMWMYDKETGYD